MWEPCARDLPGSAAQCMHRYMYYNAPSLATISMPGIAIAFATFPMASHTTEATHRWIFVDQILTILARAF